ncbi:MAG: hypothetical protein GY705_08925 [Bacteroidetes bacterium]|nr:hypothetical protein [Bacteroidota bacterium]
MKNPSNKKGHYLKDDFNLELSGSLDLASLHLTALMCFPDSIKKQKSCTLRGLFAIHADSFSEQIEKAEKTGTAHKLSGQIGKQLGKEILDYGGWGALANIVLGTGQKKGLVEDIREQYKQGIWAGEVLRLAIDRRVGITKACQILSSDENQVVLKNHNLQKHQKWSYMSIYRLFKKFRSVSHLWAAFICRDRTPKYPKRWIRFDECSTGGLNEFLEIAELFRKGAAKRLSITGPNKPVLPPDSTWKVSFK